MAGGHLTPERTIDRLNEVEVDLRQGPTSAQACRSIGVMQRTLYRWRWAYARMRSRQATRHRGLENENSRMKRLVTLLSFHNSCCR